MGKVEVRNIKKIYPNGFCAIEDLSLSIEHGEFLILLGPSGCGKSTLLRMIAGLEDVTEGEIFLDGERITHWEPKSRNLAMVFQNYALYPHMKVYDNIAFGLKMRKVPKSEIDYKVRETAKVLELEEYLNQLPGQLSGGQRQRIAMGRAMVREPKVFLMDEPLSNLDAKLRVQMREELARMHHNLHGTFIYVTHDQIEAMTLGTKVVVMNKGVIQQVSSPQEIYEIPANLFVASFIGSPAMNFFPAKIMRDSEEITLRICERDIPLPKKHQRVLENRPQVNEVTMGIRPEHICWSDSKGISVQLLRYEMLGREGIYHLQLSGENCHMLAPHEERIEEGEKRYIAFSKENIHIFDEGGNNILWNWEIS